MSEIKIRFLGEMEGSLRAQWIAVELGARAVSDAKDADFIVTTPAALDEMLEDAAATAAFQASRDQERVPIELVDRLLAGDNPVKVWREHRGLSQRVLAEQAGMNYAYLSQIETGARKGAVRTMKKLAQALGVDLGDLV
jgi:ribosome-binding protein aMBF1 (putative translation factor)